ncbi:hypothetical protein KIN20_029776 [Parelaphostrongylus tenuis]|uniref:Uncharacterized protein n=1 Tax=Parelaphostrongylus tenuis TaxID=148309 RepID=A0AAD5R305_PARTN|nr:hypothetical protein KIN20_029776 [Parelaphostrongylus tenuis]
MATHSSRSLTLNGGHGSLPREGSFLCTSELFGKLIRLALIQRTSEKDVRFITQKTRRISKNERSNDQVQRNQERPMPKMARKTSDQRVESPKHRQKISRKISFYARKSFIRKGCSKSFYSEKILLIFMSHKEN